METTPMLIRTCIPAMSRTKDQGMSGLMQELWFFQLLGFRTGPFLPPVNLTIAEILGTLCGLWRSLETC